VGSILECRREPHEFAAPGAEPASPCEFAELAGDLAVMIAAEKGDSWRVNTMQFIRVFVWHMLGMPESDYSAVKGRLKCWLIAGFSLVTASLPLPSVLGSRIADRLPLEVRHRVGSATGERLYVILAVAGASAGCEPGGRARMLALKFPCYLTGSVLSR
jgi:hypothetical protein